MAEDDQPKTRHPTMQVDIDELYASLEGRVSMPPPLPAASEPKAPDVFVSTAPPAEAPAEAGMSKGMLAAALVVAMVAAVLGAYFSTTLFEPEPMPETIMEVGPIEVE